MIVSIAVGALVLLGMLFGFNIQVSSSAINLFASLGSTLGGLGAAYAAYLSHKSIGQWKEEYYFKNTYEQLSEFENILHELISDFSSSVMSHKDFGSLSNTESLTLLQSVLKKYSKSYENTFKRVNDLLGDDNLQEFQNLQWFHVSGKITLIFMEFHASYHKNLSLAKEIDTVEQDSEIDSQQLQRRYMHELVGHFHDISDFNRDCINVIKKIKSNL